MADLYARMEFADMKRRAETVPCPTCFVEVGYQCRNLFTDLPLRGMPAHNDRIKAAAT